MQNAQRRASMGISDRHSGHFWVVGADGASSDWEQTLSYYESNQSPDGKYWYCPQGHGFYIDVSELRAKSKDDGSPIGKFSLVWR